MNHLQRSERLTLVGAGPGDPDLITLKGIKALRNADIVLYDALVSKELLAYVQPHVPKVYVGKRAGLPSVPQAEINQLIVSYAHKYGHVVRLKGGDPFVFARGYEEVAYAETHGVQVNLVPGISSIASVPGLQGIPLTRRGMNESFWVITGTLADGSLSQDIERAAQTNATVVILMGRRKLAQIVDCFQQYQRHQLPVAVIQAGSTPKEKIALGTIQTIEAAVAQQGIGRPALIVIGEVVRLHQNFAAATHLSLNAEEVAA